MQNHYKSVCRFIGKVVLLIISLAVFFSYFASVSINKKESGALPSILKRPDNYYDVILAGPSHMQRALHPAQLFGEYGIVSCNTATSAQSIPSTYYILKEMIDRHTPKLVVVDLFCMFFPDYTFSTARLHQALDFFPLNKTKIQAIYDLAKENRAEFLFNYLLYHGRWKELTKDDYLMNSPISEGYQPLLYEHESFETAFDPIPSDQKAAIPSVPLEYLKRIVDLCKNTDTQLLLTVIPYKADVDNNDVSAIYQQEIYNTIADLCREWNVDFFNGLYHFDEIGFDLTTDMAEYSHVSFNGAKKLSSYYGQYVIDHYDITNHLNNPFYAEWHDIYHAYLNLQ